MAPVTLAVQVVSFASATALAMVLGASASTDAYFLGLSVPLFVSGVLLVALRLGAIPALTETQMHGSEEFTQSCRELFSAVIVASIVLSAVVTGVTILGLPVVLAGSSDNVIRLTRLTVLELAPLSVFGAVVGVLGAILSVRGRFRPTVAVMGFDPLLRTVLVITVGERLGSQALVIGTVAGSALAAVVLWRLVVRDVAPLRPTHRINTGFVRRVLAVSSPLLIGQSVLQVNPVVDRTMASSLGPGSVTVFEMGFRLFGLPLALLGSTLIAPLTATWAARKATGGWTALRTSILGALTKICIVVPPLVVVGVCLSDELATLVYTGGAYSLHEIHETGSVLVMLILSLPAYLLVVVLSTVFVIQGNTLVPMWVAFANVLLNIVLNLVFRSLLGVSGIALSTTLTMTLLTVVYVLVAQRVWGELGLSALRALLAHCTISMFLSAAAAYGLLGLLEPASTRSSALSVVPVVSLIALLVYAGTMVVAEWVSPTGIDLRRLRLGSDSSPLSHRSDKVVEGV